MKYLFKNLTRTDYIIITLCCAVYYLLIRQYIINVDDVTYRFHNETGLAICSFGELITSLTYLYCHINGRILSHFFIQFFCSIGGYELFFACSTMALGLLLISSIALLNRYNVDKRMLPWGILMSLLFLPDIGHTYLSGVAFVVCYLWSSAMSITFIALYYHISKDKVQYTWWKASLLFLFAIVCGSWHEGFSLPIAGTLFFYHIFRLKQTTKTQYILLFGYMIGVVTLLLAPGSYARHGYTPIMNIHNWISLMAHYPFIWFIILPTCYSLYKDFKNNDRFTFLRKHWIEYGDIAFTFLFAQCVAYTNPYQFTFIAQLSIFLLLDSICTYWKPATKVLNKYSNVSVLVGLIICAFILVIRYDYSHTWHIAEQRALTGKTQIVSAREFETVDCQKYADSYFRRYIDHENGCWHSYIPEQTRRLAAYLTFSQDTTFCKLMLPDTKETIIQLCSDSVNLIGLNIYQPEDKLYRVTKLPADYATRIDDIANQYTYRSTKIISRLKDRVLKRDCRIVTTQFTKQWSRFFIDKDNLYLIEMNSTNHDIVSIKTIIPIN